MRKVLLTAFATSLVVFAALPLSAGDAPSSEDPWAGFDPRTHPSDVMYDPSLTKPAVPVPPDAVTIAPNPEDYALPVGSPPSGPAVSFHPDTFVEDPTANKAGALAACGSIQVEVRWSYLEETGNTYRYLRDATVRVWDDDFGGDYLLWVGTLDTNGYFRTGWIPNDDGAGQGTLDIYVELYSWTDPGVAVKTRLAINGYSAYTSTSTNTDPSGTGCVLNAGYWAPGQDHGAWRHYAWGLESWRHASSFDKGNMPLVKIYYPDNGAGGAPHYEKETKVISMWTGYEQPEYAYHEHGHAINHWAYGWENFPAPYAFHGRCDDNEGWNLAFGEGWAHFWSAYVKARTRGSHSVNGWSIESSTCSTPPAGGQPDNEWIVGKSMWDLYDSPADGFDLSGYGTGNLNPSTNSIWKVMWSQADPQSYGEFKNKWSAMGYSSTWFTETARQNTITTW